MKPLVHRLTAFTMISALAFGACKSKSFDAEKREEAPGNAAYKADGPIGATKREPSAPDGRYRGGLEDEKPTDNRKVIRTGRIELVVGTYDDARQKIDALVSAIGGYVDSTQVNRRQDTISDATIVIRIPSESFGSILPKLREIGEIVGESTNAADITDQYVDIAARLANAKALEKRLLELATDRNGNIEQVLAVEKELSSVRGEIEGYEGHLRQWNDQISMSTLTLSLSTKRPEIVAAVAPSLGARTTRAFYSSITSLRELGAWLVVNGIAFLPWLVLLIPGGVLLRRLARRVRLPAAFARKLPAATPAAEPPAA